MGFSGNYSACKTKLSEVHAGSNGIHRRPTNVSELYMQKPNFNVLLVEDNPDDARVVELKIAESSDLKLETVERLSRAIERLQAENFDVVLLDLNLPDASGLEGQVKLRRLFQQLPLIVLTGIDDEELSIMALQRGAQDYLVKGVDQGRLICSIHYAIERMKFQGSQKFRDSRIDRNDPYQAKPYEALTEREKQVLKLLGTGCTNLEIAAQLSISVTTVKTHMSNILLKLSVADRTNAVIEALKQGLI